MILIDVSGASAVVRKQDILTSGMVGATVVFRFDEDWNSLAKTAVFRAGKVTKDAVVADSISEIPHEVLVTPGIALEIGVYGTADEGAVVVPTVWAKTNPIKPGADPSGDESLDPSLPVWAQMQEQLNSMYRSTEEINAAKEDLLQAVEDGKDDIQATVAAGGYYTQRESDARYAPVLVGKLSGEAVTATDVSLVEHEVVVRANGKNLFDRNRMVGMALGTVILADANCKSFCLPCQEGDVFSVSRAIVTNSRFRTCFIAEEPKYGVPFFGGTGNVGTYDYAKKIENQIAPKGAKYFFLYLTNSGEEIPDIQIEKGAVATEYAAYIDPTTVTVTRYGSGETDNAETYTPSIDGTVSGVKSLSPTMTLLTDTAGVTLEVEYKRDTNAVIKGLMSMIRPGAVVANVSLPAAGWTGAANLWSQVVTIPGITENSQVNLTPSVEQLSIFYDKDITFVTENDDGVVTIYVIGQKPQNDYTIPANIVEVIV